jgi:hypothetical protein
MQGGGGQMDWYSGGSTYNGYGSSSGAAAYNYAPSSYSYNNNFEDEPPLLEGPPARPRRMLVLVDG